MRGVLKVIFASSAVLYGGCGRHAAHGPAAALRLDSQRLLATLLSAPPDQKLAVQKTLSELTFVEIYDLLQAHAAPTSVLIDESPFPNSKQNVQEHHQEMLALGAEFATVGAFIKRTGMRVATVTAAELHTEVAMLGASTGSQPMALGLVGYYLPRDQIPVECSNRLAGYEFTFNQLASYLTGFTASGAPAAVYATAVDAQHRPVSTATFRYNHFGDIYVNLDSWHRPGHVVLTNEFIDECLVYYPNPLEGSTAESAGDSVAADGTCADPNADAQPTLAEGFGDNHGPINLQPEPLATNQPQPYGRRSNVGYFPNTVNPVNHVLGAPVGGCHGLP